MKNVVWIVASVILMIGLSGCFGNTGNTEGSESVPDTTEEPVAEEPVAEEPVTDDTENPKNDETLDPNDAVSSDGSGSKDEEVPAKNRAKTKSDTIGLEGNEETFQFTLYDDPALQFSTYIVDDFLVEGASSGEGDALIVYANFAGQKNEDAKVHFYSPSNGTQTTVEEQASAAKQSLESEGFDVAESVSDAPKRFALSEKEFHISKQTENGHYFMGTVSVFKHGDRVYRMVVQYPEDWEEGFIPRVMKMIEDIMWYES